MFGEMYIGVVELEFGGLLQPMADLLQASMTYHF